MLAFRPISRGCATPENCKEAMQEDADRLVPLGTATVGAIDKLLERERDLNAQAVARARRSAPARASAAGNRQHA